MIEEVKIEDYPKWRDENPNANEVWVNHGFFGKGAPRHLPAHQPDTRQLSRATPARSSA